MEVVRIAQLKDNLSRYLRAVEAGGEVEVLDRNRPIARIVPVPHGPRVIRATRSFARVKRMTHARAQGSSDIVEVLLEERRER